MVKIYVPTWLVFAGPVTNVLYRTVSGTSSMALVGLCLAVTMDRAFPCNPKPLLSLPHSSPSPAQFSRVCIHFNDVIDDL